VVLASSVKVDGRVSGKVGRKRTEEKGTHSLA
jgi:hypothetical protein